MVGNFGRHDEGTKCDCSALRWGWKRNDVATEWRWTCEKIAMFEGLVAFGMEFLGVQRHFDKA